MDNLLILFIYLIGLIGALAVAGAIAEYLEKREK